MNSVSGDQITIGARYLTPRSIAFNKADDPGAAARDGRSSVSLRRRRAEGQLAAAQLKMRKLCLDEQYERLRVVTEVREAAPAINVAYDRYANARREVALACEIERGERTKFEPGDSTLFLVNQRERATAEAEIKLIDIQAEHEQSVALSQSSGGHAVVEAAISRAVVFHEASLAQTKSRAPVSCKDPRDSFNSFRGVGWNDDQLRILSALAANGRTLSAVTDLSRRGRRHPARTAIETAARDTGKGVRAAGEFAHDPRGCPHRRGD